MYIDRYIFEVIGFCNSISSIGSMVVYPEFGLSGSKSADRIILNKGDNILIISGVIDYMFMKFEFLDDNQHLEEGDCVSLFVYFAYIDRYYLL